MERTTRPWVVCVITLLCSILWVFFLILTATSAYELNIGSPSNIVDGIFIVGFLIAIAVIIFERIAENISKRFVIEYPHDPRVAYGVGNLILAISIVAIVMYLVRLEKQTQSHILGMDINYSSLAIAVGIITCFIRFATWLPLKTTHSQFSIAPKTIRRLNPPKNYLKKD